LPALAGGFSIPSAISHEQTPFPLDDENSINDGKPYRTVRWGKDLQLWFLETRDYRSPNSMDPDDPDKSMLGEEQIQWLRGTLQESNATFKMVTFALPVIGPDRPEATTQEERENLPGHIRLFRPPRWDNLANETWHLERTRLMEEVFAGIDNVILIVGDRHWKYHSAYPNKQNPRIHEFCSGSASDSHAQSLLRMYGVPKPSENELLYWRDPVSQGGSSPCESTRKAPAGNRKPSSVSISSTVPPPIPPTPSAAAKSSSVPTANPSALPLIDNYLEGVFTTPGKAARAHSQSSQSMSSISVRSSPRKRTKRNPSVTYGSWV
jgi:hypothetical protein